VPVSTHVRKGKKNPHPKENSGPFIRLEAPVAAVPGMCLLGWKHSPFKSQWPLKNAKRVQSI